MAHQKKISLLSALLININIIIGAGVFLNIKTLSALTGFFGFLGYAISVLVLFPFVWSIARLAEANPVQGGLYAYSKKYISPAIGFISGWSYFIGKTVSAAFLANAFTTFFQQQIPFLQPIPTLLLTCIVIFSLLLINIAGAHIGGSIQIAFFSMKTIPIIFTIVFGFSLIKFQHISLMTPSIINILSTIPVAIYALMGFEVTCTIGHLIRKPEKNIFRSIVGSFLIVSLIYILFQSIMFLALGNQAAYASEPLATLAKQIFTSTPLIGSILTALVFASVISSSFGIFTSNCWNLHSLAKDNFLPKSSFLTKTTKFNTPYVSLLLEGIIASLFLIISKNQIALQSMSVFGVVISFLCNSIAALNAAKKSEIKIKPWIPMVAILSCGYILFLCFQKIRIAGVSIPYILILLSGISLALLSAKRQFVAKSNN